jgi:2-amino-4-hydroxy-6-hydroxymethyldihydropteridine diphosphokinase
LANLCLIALGSNMRHHRHGLPARVLATAIKAMEGEGLIVRAISPVLHSVPLGPSKRRYANSAALIETKLAPDDLLDLLKAIEAAFGRRFSGQRWVARVLDLDIVLWSGGPWSSPGLTIPHIEFRNRAFVLAPALAIAPSWRDPISGLSLRQLYTRLTRPRPIPR